MKTSNKLLLGLLIVVLLGITAILGTVRYYAEDRPAKLTPVEEAPTPPEAPDAPTGAR